MTFLILAVSAFGGIVEVITVNDVYAVFGNKKSFAKKWSMIIGLLYIIAMTINIELKVTSMLLIFIVFALLASISYKISNTKIVLITILTFVIFAILEVLAAVVLSIINSSTVENILATPSTYIEVVLISKLVAYFVARFIKRLNNSKEKLLVKHGIVFLLLPISTVLILFVISFISYTTTSNVVKMLIMTVSVILIVANIAMYKLSDFMLLEIKNRNEAEKKAAIYRQEVKNYKELVIIKREDAKFSHDIKHKLFVVNELIKADNEEGGKIIEEICGMLSENEIKNYTDKKSIDSLLNAKRKGMLNEGVEPEIRVCLYQEIKVSEMDLCVILGNLMDNALESVKDMDSKIIKITITDKGKYLIVNVKNTAEDKPITLGKTSKEDKQQHGFGLPNVKEIIEMYDGELTYRYSDGMFSVNIMMKNIAR